MMATKTVPLVITYRKIGTRPPLFVAGTFSNPQWQPQEMDVTYQDDGEHAFRKEVQVEPEATVQYKFRVGSGEWWVLDENAPVVMDNAGNQNNMQTAPPASASVPSISIDEIPTVNGGSTEQKQTGLNLELLEAATKTMPNDRKLDNPKEQLQLPNFTGGFEPNDPPHPFDDPDEKVDDCTPLFTHESGLYDVVWSTPDPKPTPHDPGMVEYDPKVDPSDLGVEEMPTDREGIMEVIQSIESSRAEDVTNVSGDPLSPVLPPRKTQTLSDQYGEYKISDPEMPTPMIIPVSAHRETNGERPEPQSSTHKNDQASLGLLATEIEATSKTEDRSVAAERLGNGKPTSKRVDPTAVVSVPSPIPHPESGKLEVPGSDDDEGIALKDSTVSGVHGKLPRERPTNVAEAGGVESDCDSPPTNIGKTNTTKPPSRPIGIASKSSSVVITAKPVLGPWADALNAKSVFKEPTTDTRPLLSTQEAPLEESQLKKRSKGVREQRAPSPAILGSTHDKESGSGNWILAFLRLIFIDILGSLLAGIGWLYGKRRKT